MHRCSKCGAIFDPAKSRIKDLSWTSIFSRPNKPLPLGEDIEVFNLVKCPQCGNLEQSTELKVFGVFPGNSIKLVLAVFLAIIIMFGFWLVNSR